MSALAPHTSHPKHSTAPSRALGTCSGEGPRQGMDRPTPEPFTPMPTTHDGSPRSVSILGHRPGALKTPRLSAFLFWAGEIIGGLSLFVALFGLLILAEIYR